MNVHIYSRYKLDIECIETITNNICVYNCVHIYIYILKWGYPQIIFPTWKTHPSPGLGIVPAGPRVEFPVNWPKKPRENEVKPMDSCRKMDLLSGCSTSFCMLTGGSKRFIVSLVPYDCSHQNHWQFGMFILQRFGRLWFFLLGGLLYRKPPIHWKYEIC